MKKTLKQEKQVKTLLKELGMPFSSALGVNLQSAKEKQ
jgi:hypothetical protein